VSAESGTQWSVGESEGLDAIAFLGALSGVPLYLDEYRQEATEFSPRLNTRVIERLKELTADAASSGFGLMWPNLANVLSVAPDNTIEDVIDSLDELDGRVLAHRDELDTWSDADWQWLINSTRDLCEIVSAVRDAGFSDFRHANAGSNLSDRAVELANQLSTFDVVGQDQQLSGKDLRPQVDIVLSYFCRPHGVRVHGQRFIQSPDYDLATTLRVAAHELLHPPIDMNGRIAREAIARLEQDELIVTIVHDHDPSWGYTTVDGVLNEDLCQAIDQLVIEQLSVARNPADRWHKSDGGMHVLAAGVDPGVLHPIAARVLERPLDQLWPVAP
jgi:hypothetical protein